MILDTLYTMDGIEKKTSTINNYTAQQSKHESDYGVSSEIHPYPLLREHKSCRSTGEKTLSSSNKGYGQGI